MVHHLNDMVCFPGKLLKPKMPINCVLSDNAISQEMNRFKIKQISA